MARIAPFFDRTVDARHAETERECLFALVACQRRARRDPAFADQVQYARQDLASAREERRRARWFR